MKENEILFFEDLVMDNGYPFFKLMVIFKNTLKDVEFAMSYMLIKGAGYFTKEKVADVLSYIKENITAVEEENIPKDILNDAFDEYLEDVELSFFSDYQKRMDHEYVLQIDWVTNDKCICSDLSEVPGFYLVKDTGFFRMMAYPEIYWEENPKIDPDKYYDCVVYESAESYIKYVIINEIDIADIPSDNVTEYHDDEIEGVAEYISNANSYGKIISSLFTNNDKQQRTFTKGAFLKHFDCYKYAKTDKYYHCKAGDHLDYILDAGVYNK